MPPSSKQELLRSLRARRSRAVRAVWPTAGALAKHLDPSTQNPRHLQLIDEALADVLDGECERLIVVMPPQEGKSKRTSHYGAEWMLLNDPSLRVVIASYEVETARRWGALIRDDLKAQSLPLTLKADSQAAGRWNLEGQQGSVYCTGIGGALTGKPVDVLLIDDPVKDREQADSETYRRRVWDWWTDVARTRLAPGGRVIVIMTRWHDDDLVGRLLAQDAKGEGEGWRVLNIPAQAEHDDDVLGRKPGEYLRSARDWPDGRWDGVKKAVGSRTWNALYQGHPAPEDGDVWLKGWWSWYARPFWTVDGGTCWVPQDFTVSQSWDLSFKDLKGSDYTVGQVWARRGPDRFLLDMIRERLDFPGAVRAMRAMSAKWPQAREKLVEDKANGPAVIAQLKGELEGLIPVEPRGGKEARAAAASPLIEARNVWLPGYEAWAVEFVEEAAAFPNGVHDDMVDAASQYLSRSQVGARLIA